MTEFVKFPKIPRLSREIVVTEKIDGTNGVIYIGEDGEFLVGSRSRWITLETDNYGFAKWAHENEKRLLKLGPGTHYGEWWGSGIQRGYGFKNGEKRFSLFNTHRWSGVETRPECCGVVPVLYTGEFDTEAIKRVLVDLQYKGSYASPGFMKPEGIVIFHTQGRLLFKKTCEKDEKPKGSNDNA